MGQKIFRQKKSKYIASFSSILLWFLAVIAVYCHSDWPEWSWIQNTIAGFFSGSENKNRLQEEFKPVSPKFGLIIPRLDINIPVIIQVDGDKAGDYNIKLQSGVAHEKRTSLPDTGGNTVIFGHSSGAWGYKQTEYSEIFSRLGELKNGDQVIIWYNGVKYNYTVIAIKIVPATAIEILDNTAEKRLTLYTCWPPGTSHERLVVIAKI